VRYSQILVEKRRLEFRRDLWHQKTRRIALSCGIKNIARMFFGLVMTKHACDRQAGGRTDKTALAAASRGKNRGAQNKRSVIKSVESVLGPEGL